MISVTVARGYRGNLISAGASGHAGFGKRGADIVCASATVLLRTTLTILGRHFEAVSVKDPALKVKSAGRGSLSFIVTAYREEDILFLGFAADFLIEGIESLAKEYPSAVEIRLETVND